MFVEIRWIVDLWSVYLWILFDILWILICMIWYLCISLQIIGLVWPTRFVTIKVLTQSNSSFIPGYLPLSSSQSSELPLILSKKFHLNSIVFFIKELREDSNNIIYKLIINPQFIGSRQTHRKRRLHQIDLQEHQGEYGIEDQREREEAI